MTVKQMTVEELISKLRSVSRGAREGISEPVWFVKKGTKPEHGYYDSDMRPVDVVSDSEGGVIVLYTEDN